MVNCQCCGDRMARIKTAKDTLLRCPECFIDWFEQDVHQTILHSGMFSAGDRVGIGVSGGKDSTVLAHVLTKLNQRHDYGLDLVLLCIDEGIKGYRDDSIREVHKNEADLQLPLKLVSYKQLYGWTMDEIVAKIGWRNNCTFCGVFRRQALDRAALRVDATKLATGHNADDAAETVLMNVLRGDVGRLQRAGKQAVQQQQNDAEESAESLPRVKPLKYTFEKDIVMYAHFGRLNYFSTECVYAPNAYRMNTREYIKQLERLRPQAILDIVRSGERLQLRSIAASASGSNEFSTSSNLSRCEQCGYMTSQKYCKACLLLYGLNNDQAGAAIARKSKHMQELSHLNGAVQQQQSVGPGEANGENMVDGVEENEGRELLAPVGLSAGGGGGRCSSSRAGQNNNDDDGGCACSKNVAFPVDF